MTRAGKKFEPGHGYTREDWDAVDSPPLTPEQLAQAKPFAEMFPELAETMRRNVGDRPPLENPKQAIRFRRSRPWLPSSGHRPGCRCRLSEA